MSFSFNLIDEPWIPCLMADGSYREFGIRETLARAPDIREVVDPSPLVTVSVHRLLLAILHRNFGPRDEDEWKALWDAGAFDMGVLDAYLGKWRHCFDLFDPERPFYQVAGLAITQPKPPADIRIECATGNNATLFDHSTDDQPQELLPPEAARCLLVEQSFGRSGTMGSERRGPATADAGPLRSCALVVPTGPSLWASLLLGMVHYDPEDDAPIRGTSHDAPAWEQEAAARAGTRPCRGYLDYLTWNSRRIRLEVRAGPDGQMRVHRVHVTPGCEFGKGVLGGTLRDPMSAYRRNQKAKPGQAPWSAVCVTETRALWRDSGALLQSLPGQGERPALIDWLARLVAAGFVDSGTTYPIAVYGLRHNPTNTAQVLLWRQERLPLPLAYLSDHNLVERLTAALALAEHVGTATRRAAASLAHSVLSPDVGRNADSDAITRWCKAFPAERLYWSRLEVPFHRLLTRLPEAGGSALVGWRELIERVAVDSFERAAAGLGGSGRTLRAVVHAQTGLRASLRKLLHPDAEAPRAPEEVEYAATH